MIDIVLEPSANCDQGSLSFDPRATIPTPVSDGLPDRRGGGRGLHFSPRTLVFLEGAEAESIFQIVDGAVMLYKLLPDGRRQVVELLGPGDVFGFSPLPVRDCSAETLRRTAWPWIAALSSVPPRSCDR